MGLLNKTKLLIGISLIMLVGLIILLIMLNKPSTPNKQTTKALFIKFTDNNPNQPWSVPTYYRYAFQITINGVVSRGALSDPSDAVVFPTSGSTGGNTNPILSYQNPIALSYNKEIYVERSFTGDPTSTDWEDISTKQTTSFSYDTYTFIDSDNTSPEQPSNPPLFTNFTGSVNPWMVPTYYRISYVIHGVKSLSSSPSEKVVYGKPQQIGVIDLWESPMFSYEPPMTGGSIVIERSFTGTDTASDWADITSKITIDTAKNTFIDTNNVSEPLPDAPGPFTPWGFMSNKGPPWLVPTNYKVAYVNSYGWIGKFNEPYPNPVVYTTGSSISNPLLPFPIKTINTKFIFYRSVNGGPYENASYITNNFMDTRNPTPTMPTPITFKTWSK